MSGVNVAEEERWASALGGAALTVYAVRRLKDRTPVGAALAAAGTALDHLLSVRRLDERRRRRERRIGPIQTVAVGQTQTDTICSPFAS